MDRFALTVQVTLFTGMLAVGIALGTTIGLTELQSSCVAAGKLPNAGTVLLPGSLDDNACWEGAKRMQSIANASGVSGALLLLVGAVVDSYEEKVREVLA